MLYRITITILSICFFVQLHKAQNTDIDYNLLNTKCNNTNDCQYPFYCYRKSGPVSDLGKPGYE